MAGTRYFHNSLIWGENLTNVSITGTGMINGGGLVRDDKLLDEMCGFSSWSPTNRTPQIETNLPPARLGNKAIALKLCRNVLLRDITIFHGGHFADSGHRLRQPDRGQRDDGHRPRRH